MPASSTVRYGIIGTGMMGCEHIGNVGAIDGAEVVAIADPHAESRAWAEQVAGNELVQFEDHRHLLEAGLVDAVVVASPNHTHLDVLVDALAADVHVLTEKPLCTTVADCRSVIEAAERTSRIVWMGLEYRYMPPVARLIAEVGDGAAGDVKMVAIREHRFPFLPKVDNWNRFNRNTGGSLVEKCCHYFDLMRRIAGADPVRVMASGGQDVNHLDERFGGERPDILDNAYTIVEFDNSVRGMLDLCMFAEASRNEQEITVTGDVGKVEAFVPESIVRVGRRADRTVRVEEVRDPRVRYEGLHHGSSYLEHLDFLDAVRGDGPVRVTLDDGLWSVAMGVAAQRSIDEQRSVTLSEVL